PAEGVLDRNNEDAEALEESRGEQRVGHDTRGDDVPAEENPALPRSLKAARAGHSGPLARRWRSIPAFIGAVSCSARNSGAALRAGRRKDNCAGKAGRIGMIPFDDNRCPKNKFL